MKLSLAQLFYAREDALRRLAVYLRVEVRACGLCCPTRLCVECRAELARVLATFANGPFAE